MLPPPVLWPGVPDLCWPALCQPPPPVEVAGVSGKEAGTEEGTRCAREEKALINAHSWRIGYPPNPLAGGLGDLGVPVEAERSIAA